MKTPTKSFLCYPEDKVQKVINETWSLCGCHSDGTANFEQATIVKKTEVIHFQGLKAAMVKLSDVAPKPSENWYRLVFSNFDVNHRGRITFSSYSQIIKQYHDYHARRNLEEVKEGVSRRAAGKKKLSIRDSTSKPASDLSSITRVPESHGKSNNLEFISNIVYPSHYGKEHITQNYDIELRNLGEGAFSHVHLARHKKTKQLRVCKTINVTSSGQWELIKLEVELMRSLNHPNILRLHETYYGGYTIYLILELCEGGPMYDRICEMDKPIMEQQVAQWMRQILSATALCHEKNVVHRDLKPENILFVNKSNDSPLKVIDFGLSSTLEKIRETQHEIIEKRKGVSAVLAKMLPKIQGRPILSGYVKRLKMQCAGTPHYMAPEMIQGVYNEKCDMFSVGVILYQLLSGRHPFFTPQRDNQQTVREKILNENPPTDSEEWKAVSPQAISLVKWMLQKDPRRRCSAKEALNHSWFKAMSQTQSGFTSQLTNSVFDGLRNWQQQNCFKKAFTRLLARELSEAEIVDLRKKFEALDRGGDGTITLDELRYSVQHANYSIKDSELQHVFSSLDSSGNNKIHYMDFISALLCKRVNFEETQLVNIFSKFDVNGEGRISFESLKQVLKEPKYNKLWTTDIQLIFNEIDKNKDGYVDFYEFHQLMTS